MRKVIAFPGSEKMGGSAACEAIFEPLFAFTDMQSVMREYL